MGRFVTPRPTRARAAGGGTDVDGPGARIAKYLPAEVVSLYAIIINGLAATGLTGTRGRWITVGLIALFTIGTIVFIWSRAPANQPDVLRKHLFVSPLSFVAWSYPLSASLLGDWFVAWAAIVGQGVVLLLALILVPTENA